MGLLRSLIDPALPRRTRLLRLALLVAILMASALRVWVVFRYNPMDHLWSDPGRHWHFGTRPLDVQPMVALDPIGYQTYIAVLAKVTTKVPLLVAYWTAWLSVLGPWLWYRFLRELLPSREWALAGWALLAALPSWVAIYSYFMQETLMLPLLGAALWATWRCRRKQTTGAFVLATAIWLAAGLTRGICLPLGLVALSWIWLSQPRKLAAAAASAVLVLAVVGPLAGRSWSLVRMISPHGVGQLVQIYQGAGTESITVEFTRRDATERFAYTFTSPAINEPPLRPLSDWHAGRAGTFRFEVDLDAGGRDWQAAKDRLPPWEGARALRLTADNLAQLFVGASWPDTNRERLIGRINHAVRWLWVPLTLAAMVATAYLWRRRRERLILALMSTWVAVQGLFPLSVNEGRYRKPYEGLLIAQCLLLVAGSRRDGRAKDLR